MVEGFEIDYARVLITLIRERDFKTSTIHPLACLIFQLCKEAGVQICQCDTLRIRVRTVGISLISDKANIETPRRGTQIEISTFSGNIEDMIELAEGADTTTFDPTNTTLTDSTHAASFAPNSSLSTPSSLAIFPP